MKWILRIFGVLVLILVLAVIFRNQLVKAAVSIGARQATGLEVGMEKLDINLSETYVDIDRLKVRQPEGFPEGVFIGVPDVYVDYVLGDILGGNLHFTEVRLHLEVIEIVKNKEGQLNIQVVQEKLATKEKEEQEEAARKETPEEKKEATTQVQIDLLKLKVERAVYTDYSMTREPVVQKFDLNIEESFENITDFKAIVTLIISKALRNSTIARLTNLNPDEFLQQNVYNTLTMTNELATQIGDTAVGTVDKAVGGATGQASRAVSGTTDAVKKKADQLTGSLKDAVNLPFGKKDEE